MSEPALSGCHMLGDILVSRTVDRSYAGHSKSLNFARKSVKMLEFDFLKLWQFGPYPIISLFIIIAPKRSQ